MQIARVVLFLCVIAVAWNAGASDVTVLKHPDLQQSLSSRWVWALQKGGGQFQDGFWVVYTFKRLMEKNETIGFYTEDQHGPTLFEVLTGGRSPAKQDASKRSVTEEARRILNETEGAQEEVWKEVAVLVRFEKSIKNIERVSLSNLHQTYPLKRLPVVLLGPAESSQSIELLKSLYDKTEATKRKEDIIAAIALHQKPELVLPFLKQVVTNQQDSSLRESAVFWLGQTDEPEALKFLVNLINNPGSTELRKKAVFSISQMNIPEASQALMKFAQQAGNSETRLEAIFWISQQGYPEAPKVLEKIAFEETDEEVQKKAVFSISQLRGRTGRPVLTRIAAKHPDTNAREEAVFWLGQTGGESEANVLEKIVQEDANFNVKKKAIFSLSQMNKDLAIPRLERIAKNHPDREMRKEAIFWLGQMQDRRATDILLKILKTG